LQPALSFRQTPHLFRHLRGLARIASIKHFRLLIQEANHTPFFLQLFPQRIDHLIPFEPHLHSFFGCLPVPRQARTLNK
jgi:hypothetical protein